MRIGDAHALIGHFRRERRGKQLVPGEIALVFDDERAAIFGVVEQAPVHARQIGAQLVGADADDDRVVVARDR